MRRRGCWASGTELDVQVHLMSSVFFRSVHFCFITRVLFFSLSVLFFFGRRLTLHLLYLFFLCGANHIDLES